MTPPAVLSSWGSWSHELGRKIYLAPDNSLRRYLTAANCSMLNGILKPIALPRDCPS